MFRRFKASARHIRRRFPGAKLHDTIINAVEKEPDREFSFCHTMMPAAEYEYYDTRAMKAKRGGGREPWVSVYYDSEHRMLLRESPSERFRYVVERWGTISGSQYGYSPAAMTALAASRGMQAMAMILQEAGEKELDPPVKATEGAVTSDIDMGAGGITWVDKTYDERMGPTIDRLYSSGRNFPIGIELINRATLEMRDIWYLTKLTLPQYGKTATETVQLVEEFIRANIPLFEPWETGVAMMLDEMFSVMIDMNLFGDMAMWPRELSGRELIFSFANPLQDAIKRSRGHQATQVFGLVAGAMQIDPAAAKAVNVLKITQDSVRSTGGPAEWLNDEQDAARNVADAGSTSDVLGALNLAGQAAGVVKTGAEAVAGLQQLNQPAADSSFVYGPT